MKKITSDWAIKQFHKSLNNRIEPMSIDGLLFQASEVLYKCNHDAYVRDYEAWLHYNDYEVINC